MKSIFLGLLFLSAPAFSQQLPVAGCGINDFVVASGPTALITTEGRNYVPRCLKISRGTQVVIQASTHHPLQGILSATGLENPIFDEFGGAVSDKTLSFANPGVFGFYCLAHSDDQGSGMGGAILVE